MLFVKNSCFSISKTSSSAIRVFNFNQRLDRVGFSRHSFTTIGLKFKFPNVDYNDHSALNESSWKTPPTHRYPPPTKRSFSQRNETTSKRIEAYNDLTLNHRPILFYKRFSPDLLSVEDSSSKSEYVSHNFVSSNYTHLKALVTT